MAATRPSLNSLRKLFDSAVDGLAIIDGSRQILFVNEALAAWSRVAAEELFCQTCHYHSEPAGSTSAVTHVAALLCPPPQAFAGESLRANVTRPGESADAEPWQLEFIPFVGADGEAALVVVRLSKATTVGDAEPSDELDATALHESLAAHRRRLADRYSRERLLGKSVAAQRIRAQVELAIAGHCHVSIVGPAGSGRQFLARVIHQERGQQEGTLVPLVCNLLTVELLRNTWRALIRGKSSSVAASLLLLDADQLTAEVQAELWQLAGVAAALAPVVRIVATSQRALASLADSKEFRADLATLLTPLVIELPPLCERTEDIPLVAQALLEHANLGATKQLGGFTPDALDRLLLHAWPGNLDELAAVLSAAHDRAAGPLVTLADLPEALTLAAQAAAFPRRADERIVLNEYLAQIERELIVRALGRAKGNKAKAARLLGMTRPRLYRRMVQIGLEPPRNS